MGARTIHHGAVEAELLANPEVRRAYEALEPAYQVARLGIMLWLAQQKLMEGVDSIGRTDQLRPQRS